MPEYINKDYYRQLAPGDRSFRTRPHRIKIYATACGYAK